MFPTSVSLLRKDHSPWECVHLFQTINARSTLHVAIKNWSFLKNEASLPKVLESWSNNPCILLWIAIFHGCSQDVDFYVGVPMLVDMLLCGASAHVLWPLPFLCGFPWALLLLCLWLSCSSQFAQSRPATALCAVSPYCSTLYSVGHPLATAHEISSLNLCPSHCTPNTSLSRRNMAPLNLWVIPSHSCTGKKKSNGNKLTFQWFVWTCQFLFCAWKPLLSTHCVNLLIS